MIPAQKSAAVARALQQVFSTNQPDDIRQLTKGQTQALVFAISVRGSHYLLRINMHPHSIGPQRYFACMSSAAQAGLAPRVLYTSAEDEIVITDFVDEVPFAADDALAHMPGVLRQLHGLPFFPDAPAHLNTTCTLLLNSGPAVEGFHAAFQKAVQAANAVSAETCRQLLALHAELAAACPRNPSDLVSCHNDLFKPDNVLFDGKRVWLVDWEAAFRNNRYADLAVAANLLVADDQQEHAFLTRYFNREPTPKELASLFLMRQLAHLFYAMAFLMLGAAGSPGDDPTMGFDQFRRRFWSGEVSLVGTGEKFTYGRVSLEQLLENVGRPRYREALQIARSHTA